MLDHAGTQKTKEDMESYFLTVSHELKAPLTEISAYAKILEEDCAELLPNQSKEDLHAIQNICEKALKMIRNYADYSRIQISETVPEKIDLRALMEEVFRELTAPLRDRKIDLSLPWQVPDLIADRSLLTILIKNIFTNSIKFTADRETAQISMRWFCKDDVTEFCFEDNGKGASQEFTRRALDLFEKTEEEDNPYGSGIGLNLVKGIAERFGGSISISSIEGEIFSLQISLPNRIVVLPETTSHSRDEIRIGVIGAVTGDYSEIAPGRRYAYQLAVDEINATGGILGRKVRLLFRDFHSDPKSVPEIAWELAASDRVDVLMGGQLSSARDSIREVIHQMKIPYFFNALYEGGLADHYTFCISSTPEQNVYPMIDQMLPVHGRKCYIIAADYNYGVLSAECTRDYIEKKGGMIAGIEYFTPTKTDFVDSIERICHADPDILVSFCVGNNQTAFHAQWHKFGNPGIPVISTIGIGLSSLHRKLPAPVMRNTYFMSSYLEELDTKAATAFTRKIRAKYTEEAVPYIEFDAETAYTAVYLYKKAVERAGSTETEKVISALESGQISFDGPGGPVIVRGEDHHVVRDEIMFCVNEENRVGKTMYFPAQQTHFVETALEQEYGRRTSLRELGSEAPDTQYNVLYRRIIQ